MSQETVDYFNDMKEIQALERKQRLAGRQLEIQEVRKLGYAVRVFNGGYQIDIRHMSYWPSTGKWRNNRMKRHGWLQDGESLLDLVRREVGEAGPVLAKKLAERASA